MLNTALCFDVYHFCFLIFVHYADYEKTFWWIYNSLIRPVFYLGNKNNANPENRDLPFFLILHLRLPHQPTPNSIHEKWVVFLRGTRLSFFSLHFYFNNKWVETTRKRRRSRVRADTNVQSTFPHSIYIYINTYTRASKLQKVAFVCKMNYRETPVVWQGLHHAQGYFYIYPHYITLAALLHYAFHYVVHC